MRGTFERDRLPARSTLSRFLAALTEVPVEALRTLFLDDARSAPALERKTNRGLVDRAGKTWDIRSQEVHYRAEQRFSYGNIDLE